MRERAPRRPKGPPLAGSSSGAAAPNSNSESRGAPRGLRSASADRTSPSARSHRSQRPMPSSSRAVGQTDSRRVRGARQLRRVRPGERGGSPGRLVDEASALLLLVLMQVGRRTGTLRWEADTGGGRLRLVRFDSLVDVWLDEAQSLTAPISVVACWPSMIRSNSRALGSRPTQEASLLLRSSVETRWRVTPKCSAICSIVRPSS